MRKALAAAAVLAAVGCKQEQQQPPTTTVVEWAQQSPDGRFEIRQRRDGTGCRVQAVVKSADGDRALWSTQTCLPTPSGLAFLSANGEKVLVLDLFPSSRAAQASDWSSVPLISLWVRGAVVRQYTGAEILGQDRVTQMGSVLSWVRGDTLEDARRAARASTDGDHITIQLVDGNSLTLGFEGNPLPVPSAPPAKPARFEEPVAAVAGNPTPPPVPVRVDALPRVEQSEPLAADEQGLYRWEDDQGALHFGVGAQVPARYRKRARPVDGSVGVIPLDRSEPAAAAPRAPPGSPPAPGPAPAPAGQPTAAPAAQPGPAAPPAGGAPPPS